MLARCATLLTYCPATKIGQPHNQRYCDIFLFAIDILKEISTYLRTVLSNPVSGNENAQITLGLTKEIECNCLLNIRASLGVL